MLPTLDPEWLYFLVVFCLIKAHEQGLIVSNAVICGRRLEKEYYMLHKQTLYKLDDI